MIKTLKIGYRFFKSLFKKLQFFFSVNWLKTLYFNFKMLPFNQAKKLPFYFYGSVKFTSLKGKVVIDAPITRAMFGFGQQYEMTTRERGIAEISINGSLIVKGNVQFGKDYFFFIKDGAQCTLGHMSSMATSGKLICTKEISLGNWARLGSECQIIDTNFHQLIDIKTKEKFPISSAIHIGNYNFISNRVTILSKTCTSAFTTVASNSVCSKDYSYLGENILIGGLPAELIRKDITRDWEGEQDRLLKHLIV